MKRNKGSWCRIFTGAIILLLGLPISPASTRAQEQSSPPAEEGVPVLPGLDLQPSGEAPGPAGRRPRRQPRQVRPSQRQRPTPAGRTPRMERGAGKLRMREMGQQDCWACHRLPNLETATGNQEIIFSCLNCHRNEENLGKVSGSKGFALHVDYNHYRSSTHGRIACISCHDQVARLPHSEIGPLACASCHRGFACPVAGEAHPGMECALCHVEGNVIKASGYQDPVTGLFVAFPRAKVQVDDNNRDREHDFTSSKPCATCHSLGNALGAPFPRLFTLAPWLAAASLLGLLGLLLRIQRSLRQLAKDQARGPWTTLARGLRRITLSPGEREFLRIAAADLILCRRYWRESVGRGLAMILFTIPFLIILTLQALKAWGAAMGVASGWIVRLTHDPSPLVLDWLTVLTGLALAGVVLSLLLPKRPDKNLTAATPGDQPWLALSILFFLLSTLYSLTHPMPAFPPLQSLLGIGWFLGKLGTLISLALVPWSADFLGDWAEPLAERIAQAAGEK